MSALEAFAPDRMEPEPAGPEDGLTEVGPHFGHALLLLMLTGVFAMVVVPLAFTFAMDHLRIYGGGGLRQTAAALKSDQDPRWLIPIEAAGYALVVLAAVPLFRGLWRRSFASGLHWNGSIAVHFFGRLVLLGLACGFGIGLLGSRLPMPKDPPILDDIMQSQVGAWLMFAFGITGAPLFEEMFFRGFLLPAFLNFFRWLSINGSLARGTALWVGVPVSVLLTSLPFALLHAQQVAHAWAPVLLIGIVSVVLCIVRLRLNSLACSTVVHAAYNFTLFAGILVQTGGFRHLDRLSH